MIAAVQPHYIIAKINAEEYCKFHAPQIADQFELSLLRLCFCETSELWLKLYVISAHSGPSAGGEVFVFSLY